MIPCAQFVSALFRFTHRALHQHMGCVGAGTPHPVHTSFRALPQRQLWVGHSATRKQNARCEIGAHRELIAPKDIFHACNTCQPVVHVDATATFRTEVGRSQGAMLANHIEEFNKESLNNQEHCYGFVERAASTLYVLESQVGQWGSDQ